MEARGHLHSPTSLPTSRALELVWTWWRWTHNCAESRTPAVRSLDIYGHIFVDICWIWCSSVSTRLRAWRPVFWQGQWSRAHSASFPVGTGGLLSRGKAVGAWRWPLTPSSAKVKNAWSCTSTTQYVLTEWCLIKRKDFTFSLPVRITFGWAG
jgi:hypothetical protein